MADISSGSDTAPGASDDPDSNEGGAQRGLFGRLFGARAPVDAENTRPRTAADVVALPGLSNLRRLRVADVAVPKAEIVAVPEDISRDDLLDVFRDSGFSRMPVYRETLDRPVGQLLLKDLVLRSGFDLRGGALDLKGLLRPLLFVPPSMPLNVLLQKMQGNRTHMALVIDEYGGVDGLVTIEDLLEQVVGEIDDEHDTEDENLWTQEAAGIWQVQARADLVDLAEDVGVNLADGIAEDEEIDTLGGLVFLMLGRVPARGEVIPHPAGFEIEVLDADPRRIKRLRLRRSAPTPVAADT
jgi:magnesium and cobalt transporter